MADQTRTKTSLNSAIHKIQLILLEGITNPNQLTTSATLLSQADYKHVVIERSISNICGFPLCPNTLTIDNNKNNTKKYRISLKEHKVYDLEESRLYCSTSCVVSSKSFQESLRKVRFDDFDVGRVNEVLRVFEGLGVSGNKFFGGFGELKIEERDGGRNGDVVGFEEWVGPSNAIEGYVPVLDLDRKFKPPPPKKNRKDESKTESGRQKKDKGKLMNETDFTSSIIVGDSFGVPELSYDLKQKCCVSELEELKGDEVKKFEVSSVGVESEFGIPEMVYDAVGDVTNQMDAMELEEDVFVKEMVQSNEAGLKSSLKSSGSKKLSRNVTWADKRIAGSTSTGKLCEIQEMGGTSESAESLRSSKRAGDGGTIRLESAEACALALSQAAEAVASGEFDVTDAVSEAGIKIWPQPYDADKYSEEEEEMIDPELVPLRWPKKPGVLNSEEFNPEESWYDPPPVEFSLTLSPFATMWMALFGWITSSSLAYIYGQDESSHQEFLLVNGREYPEKIVLIDGRSLEIKQALAGCLSRAIPKVATDLRLKTPFFAIEKEMGNLLSTMSFVEALPAFKLKQWHVIALLFIDALSVCRIPGLAPNMTSGRILLQKVLDEAQVTADEYDTMKGLLIPLGRVPQFSAQCGA
ncbi:hypothetical protein IFM89_005558 [Coptis chinensis]|uniref:RNA polymerase II subunit B1 CTD phosphatase RPAP2 homolog n=1 Tax=Coptis chinensis TaxID=261450 RepID=A0A835LLH4_9MAGN|nr:hypothetical protein IFM89_005558 [Coptis chinensis]